MYPDKDIIAIASDIIQLEGEALIESSKQLDDSFVQLVRHILKGKGRVVVSGMGKSAQVGQKIVATLNSTGTPALFMHAADAIHGDLGIIQPDDQVLCLSKSGNTPEIKVLIPLIKALGNPVYALVSDPGSYLEAQADLTIRLGFDHEACPYNLIPTTSTTLQLAFGDALAVTLLKIRGFSQEDFARLHPGGSLGKRLYLRVSDLSVHNMKPKVQESDPIRKVILEISSNRLGATAVLDQKDHICGIITDGDLRRMMEQYPNTDSLSAGQIMSRHPISIGPEEPAIRALNLMRKNAITQLLVVENHDYQGIIHIHDILREGIV